MCKCSPFNYTVCSCSVNSIYRQNEVYHDKYLNDPPRSIWFFISMILLPCCSGDVGLPGYCDSERKCWIVGLSVCVVYSTVQYSTVQSS